MYIYIYKYFAHLASDALPDALAMLAVLHPRHILKEPTSRPGVPCNSLLRAFLARAAVDFMEKVGFDLEATSASATLNSNVSKHAHVSKLVTVSNIVDFLANVEKS